MKKDGQKLQFAFLRRNVKDLQYCNRNTALRMHCKRLLGYSVERSNVGLSKTSKLFVNQS